MPFSCFLYILEDLGEIFEGSDLELVISGRMEALYKLKKYYVCYSCCIVLLTAMLFP
jgi:hypothetical protein